MLKGSEHVGSEMGEIWMEQSCRTRQGMAVCELCKPVLHVSMQINGL